MEGPKVFIIGFGASEEGLSGVWRKELNRCRGVDGMTIGAKEGTDRDQVVGEDVVGANITRNGLGFEREVKKASIRARGSEEVPVGEGESEGR